MELIESAQADICRVCLSEGMPEWPLFHPCRCSGTIKYVHQHCLLQWMRYSTKDYCELCTYRFLYTPVYASNMPQRVPIKYVVDHFTSSLLTGIKCSVHLTLMVLAWLCILPFITGWVYRGLFIDSVDTMMSFDIKSIYGDIYYGILIVTLSLLSFAGFLSIRFQLQVGGPDWLERDELNMNQQQFNVLLPLNPEENLVEDDEDNGEFNEDDGEFDEDDIEFDEDGEFVELDGEFMEFDGEFMEIDAEFEEIIGEINEINVDILWDPIGWGDQALGGLTLDQLLGFDGSWLFLKLVPWLVCINTSMLLLFAFFPYKVGNLAITTMVLQDKTAESYIFTIVAILCGYCLIGSCLMSIHTFATIIGFRRTKRIIGLCYIFVKVFLLFILEIGVLPFIYGWWIDICSLSMFDSSFEDTVSRFYLAPKAFMLIHWLVGIIYIYYFVLFIRLLQDIVRPGLLWFIPSINNPGYNPLQELVHHGILLHGRRLITLAIVFLTIAFFIEWLPIKILKYMFPSFFPYNVTMRSGFANTISMETIFLQILLPVILGQLYACSYFKMGIHLWCIVVSYLIGIKSYLLGDEERFAYIHHLVGGLGIDREEVLRRLRLVRVLPYTRPTSFAIRLITLLILATLSVVVFSSTVIIIQIWLGHLVKSFFTTVSSGSPGSPSRFPDLNGFPNTLMEIYVCWYCLVTLRFREEWLPVRPAFVNNRFKFCMKIVFNAVVACIVLLYILPYLFGLLLQYVVVVPYEVPLNQTPLNMVRNIWASGQFYMKCIAVIILVGPNCHLRRIIDRIFRNGIIHLDLKFILKDFAVPMFIILSLSLATPYVIAYSVVPLIVKSQILRLWIARRIYPTLIFMAVIIYGIMTLVRIYKRVCIQIKNDKYLVGKKLLNYNCTTLGKK